jgi:glycosyltransferase involved in cell wall biosynthesis
VTEAAGAVRPHALYVALGFPPSRGSGVFRAMATAHGLLEAGFDVTVLTVDRDFWFHYTGADEELEKQVDQRLRIVRVPLQVPMQEWDLRRWSRGRRISPRVWRKVQVRRDRRQPFPEVNYGAWADPVVDAAVRIHEERRVDVTVATVNPNVDAYAAYRLKERYDVPYVIDQRDAWTLMQFTGERLHPVGSPQVAWERRLFEGAAEVWFVNSAMREWHAGVYPAAADRMRVVMNGWDPGLVVPAPPRTGDGPVRFGFLGTLTTQVPLQAFLDGWRMVAGEPTMAGATADIRGHLGFYRAPNQLIAQQLLDAADVGVRYGGSVAKTAIASTYTEWDALLMLLGGGRYVTSGKVFEYVATGLPVVSVTPTDSGANEVLRDYPLWFPAVSLDPAHVAVALRDCADAVRSSGPAERDECVEYAQRFRRDVQLEPAMVAARRIAGADRPAS